MSLWIFCWEVRMRFKNNKNRWQSDKTRKFRINSQVITEYFNKEQHLVFGDDSAQKEEKTILPFINISEESRVLDLGCGNGRWCRLLINRCKEYVGVDISQEFIKKTCEKYKNDTKVKFFNMAAQDYVSKEKYDLILIIGLITYLNDDEVIKLSGNCRNMLNKDGQIILRNVTLKEKQPDRMVYDYRPNLMERLFGKPGYQLIRRNVNEELKLFKGFELLHTQPIKGTGYTFYVLE